MDHPRDLPAFKLEPVVRELSIRALEDRTRRRAEEGWRIVGLGRSGEEGEAFEIWVPLQDLISRMDNSEDAVLCTGHPVMARARGRCRRRPRLS